MTGLNLVSSGLYQALRLFRNFINNQCAEMGSSEIIFYTCVTVVLMFWLHRKIFNTPSNKPLKRRAKEWFFGQYRRIPFIRRKFDKELEIVKKTLHANKLYKLKQGMYYKQALPHRGMSHHDVLKEAEDYLTLDQAKWKIGNVSGAIYSGSDKLNDLVSKVYEKFGWSNSLYPEIYPAVRKMEAEIIRMVCKMFNGHPFESCGSISSGGTESILLACKAYREWAYAKGITHPEMIVPITAHAAFEKAAEYFNIKLIHIPLDPRTWQVDLRAMKRAIGKNTCMLVGSAPNFPHGIIDPISEISALGVRYGIPVHVDACLCGFLIAFMEEGGYPLPLFDFRLRGVTSISANTHTYGYTPMGTSCILYASKKWIHYQYFVSPDRLGGLYATPTLLGSRAGALVAVAWATMLNLGHSGYVECTKKIISTCRYIITSLSDMDYIYVCGDPLVSVIAVGSSDFDIDRLSVMLSEHGWSLELA